MKQLTAWIITIIGVLLVLPLIGLFIGTALTNWLVALGVLIIGLSMLVKDGKKKK